VHAWFDDRAVAPRFQQIVLPSLWPRKHNTRGGPDVDVDGDGDAEGAEADADAVGEGPEVVVTGEGKAEQSLEQRIMADGAKMRDAEVRAGEREVGGMRWRGEGRERERERSADEYSGQKGMPGAMLG
jgi:maintenance of morphology protein 1